jgi:hypothetical protein
MRDVKTGFANCNLNQMVVHELCTALSHREFDYFSKQRIIKLHSVSLVKWKSKASSESAELYGPGTSAMGNPCLALTCLGDLGSHVSVASILC